MIKKCENTSKNSPWPLVFDLSRDVDRSSGSGKSCQRLTTDFCSFEASKLQALSPAHFLTGRRITTLPKTQVELPTDSSRNELTWRSKHRQRTADILGSVARGISSAAPLSSSGSAAAHAAHENVLVAVHDNKLPRHLRKTARILHLHQERDGHIRS